MAILASITLQQGTTGYHAANRKGKVIEADMAEH